MSASYNPKGLCIACKQGNLALIQAALRAGVSLDVTDLGYTALMWASMAGHLAIVEVLIAAGVDLNATFGGSMALMWASRGGHLAVVEVLLSAGADVNVSDQYGRTALDHASDNPETFSLIQEAIAAHQRWAGEKQAFIKSCLAPRKAVLFALFLAKEALPVESGEPLALGDEIAAETGGGVGVAVGAGSGSTPDSKPSTTFETGDVPPSLPLGVALLLADPRMREPTIKAEGTELTLINLIAGDVARFLGVSAGVVPFV